MQAALDSLAAGATGEAEAILLAALEDEPELVNGVDHSLRQPFRCPDCSSSYRWQGELERHRGLVHGVWSDAA